MDIVCELLVSACKEGNISLVERLLRYNNVSARYDNDAPIIGACCYGHDNIVKYLLNKGVDVNVHDGFLINYSSAKGDYGMVKLLLEYGSGLHNAIDYATGKEHIIEPGNPCFNFKDKDLSKDKTIQLLPDNHEPPCLGDFGHHYYVMELIKRAYETDNQGLLD